MISRWLNTLARTLLRLSMLAIGLVIGLAALVMGLLLTVGLVGWALLRGRRPVPVQAFRWRGVPRPGSRPGAAAEVVDIEAYEVAQPHAAAARPLIER